MNNPYESYDGPQEVPDTAKVPCAHCGQAWEMIGDMAEINREPYCSLCLDPKQPAHDAVMAWIEQQESTILGLRRELLNLRYELRVAKGRAA